MITGITLQIHLRELLLISFLYLYLLLISPFSYSNEIDISLFLFPLQFLSSIYFHIQITAVTEPVIVEPKPVKREEVFYLKHTTDIENKKENEINKDSFLVLFTDSSE